VVNIVGTHRGPDKLLEQVILFIGASCRGKAAYGIRTILGLDLFELCCDQIQCFLPRRLSEMAFLFYERGLSLFGSFMAVTRSGPWGQSQPSLIVFFGGDADYLIASDVQGKGAAAAQRDGSICFLMSFCLPCCFHALPVRTPVGHTETHWPQTRSQGPFQKTDTLR
jgi:hypothetical protein